tara:strand:- start:231 stop:908 length:678 start_codon:yes stop_codon:yes gene_type:complete
MKAILHDDLKLDALDVRTPRRNRTSGSMSALSTGRPQIQWGTVEEPCCRFNKLVDNRFVNIHLKTLNIRRFYEEFENALVNLVYRRSVEWFNKELSEFDVKRMLCSLMNQERDIVLKVGKAVQCYHLQDGDNIENIDLKDIPSNSLVVPIVRFDGIFIAKHHYSISLTMEQLLVLGKDDIIDAPVDHPFVLCQDEDILDPHAHSIAQEYDDGSFETHKFTGDDKD